jgi:signal transduction histidine kinase
MGRDTLLAALGILGVAFGAGSEALQLGAGADPQRVIIDLMVGGAYLAGGLFGWRRDPRNATWRLMVAIGFGWFVGNYAVAESPFLRGASTVLADSDAILLIALVLSYPSGRLQEGLHRGVVAMGTIGLTAANAVYLATGASTPNLVLGLALTLAMLFLVPRRLVSARADERRLLTPAVVATIITILAVAIGILVQLLRVSEPLRSVLLSARDVGVLAIPLGFVAGSFQLADERLRRSRARIVQAADEERVRLERDLHDGAQQRLVTLSLALRSARSRLGDEVAPDVARALDAASDELKAGIEELRELAHGIRPAVLTEAGLAGALPTLADRAAIPTLVTDVPEGRLTPAVEAAVYFVVSEALSNAAKHAHATAARVSAKLRGDLLLVTVSDDGRGGADADGGTGLVGLGDRVAAVGGELRMSSPAGAGTVITASIPISDSGLPPWSDDPDPLTIGGHADHAHR